MIKYDVIYYWVGGRVEGQWHATLGYSEEMLESVRHMGYVAHPGRTSIGAPEGPPSLIQLQRVLPARYA